MKFMIEIRQYSKFNECLWFSMTLPARPCKTKHLGECATPPLSACSDDASDAAFHDLFESFEAGDSIAATTLDLEES